ncbi:MAG: hypothetical protein AAF405_07980, partial [Pseudomonadota bacterium]
ASVIGRDFTLEALVNLASLSVETVQEGLDSLCEAGLVHRRRGQQFVMFEFKHALVRDAAYESLLRERRRTLHSRFAANAKSDANPELVAFHYTEAREWRAGATSWIEAGTNAARKSAHREALEHFHNALACLEMLDDDNEPLTLSCTIDLAFGYRNLGQPDDVIRTLAEIDDLIARAGGPEEQAKVHYLRGVAFFVLGEVDKTFEEEQAALAAAREANSPEFEARALSSLGDAAYASKRVHSANEYQRECAELAKVHGLTQVAIDNATCFEATHRHISGTADPQYVVESIELAVDANLLRAESILCAGAAWTFAHRNEVERSLEFAERGTRAAHMAGSELWHTYCLSAQARTLTLLGRQHEGYELAQACVQSARATGSAIVGGLAFGAMAISANDADELLEVLDEGVRQLKDGDAAHCHVDFYRDAIDACLNKALWQQALRFVRLLREFNSLEPLQPAEFMAARGELLARVGLGERGPSFVEEAQRLITEGRTLGLTYFVSALSDVIDLALDT